jgi:ATP-dependent protease HslVU (ClpYQ) peptidase subunit
MTTIIGLQYDDHCAIVVDSRVVDPSGYIYTHPDSRKITERNGFLIAGSGEVTPCDVAQHIWDPPRPTKADKKDLFHFMVSKVIPSLRKCFADNGIDLNEAKTEQRFQFLIAICGEIFDIDDELSVSRNEDGIYGIGSGGTYAIGALYAGADAYQAMEIASTVSAFTAPPYYSKEQFKHN